MPEIITGRPDHIEDILVELHGGCWFDWTDAFNKVYENLIIKEHEMPTKEFLDSELKRKQEEFDSKEYARNRATAYASTGDQLDMQYWDSVNDTTTWKDHVASVKDQFPKV